MWDGLGYLGVVVVGAGLVAVFFHGFVAGVGLVGAGLSYTLGWKALLMRSNSRRRDAGKP